MLRYYVTHDLCAQAMGYGRKPGRVQLSPGGIEKKAAAKGLRFDLSLSATLAHEAFKHAISGGGHYSSSGYVDSEEGKYKGSLSPRACRDLAKDLGFGEPP